MTRRARMGPLQTLNRGVDRMAPGGRRSASESPVRPFYRPVGEAGDAPAGPVSVTLRPVLLEGFIPSFAAGGGAHSATLTLVGGAGNGTLADSSDGTYARMTAYKKAAYVGSVKATFETPTLGWEPSAATLTCRVRALVDTHPGPPADPGALYWEFKSPTGEMYAKSSDYPPNTRWFPGGSGAWMNMPSDSWMTQFPPASDVAAGVSVFICAYADAFTESHLQLDVSDVWLLLEGTL